MTNQRHRHHRRGLCFGLTVLALLYVAALIVLEKLVPERHVLAFLLVHAPQLPLLLPVAVLAPLCLILRRPRLALLNLVALTCAVMVLAPPALRRPARDDAIPHIRVVTWNVHHETRNLPAIQEVLAGLKPDIVCLQEAREEGLAGAFPGAQTAHTHEVRTFVRGRIVAQRALPLSDPSHGRWGMATEVELPQGRVSVLNVHYVVGMKSRVRAARRSLPDEIQITRSRQNETVLRWLRETPGPRLVCGDFNTPPSVQLYRDLGAHAVNAFDAAGSGWGFTFPRRLPMIRIDHVWCAGGVVPVRCRAMDGTASDHCLVVADIRLPR